eukprot:CAMPEP_0201232332 /NCGR_PEP_ID=MMETSP0852-20130820/4203_1 /ASSEMBLY_ACC=CAM_ASM_000632 /TAXON_ID=183588 /ORGANISM="Pseudo-nitzschia fraudulenta, Strain WWA7" /LENGTH=107 /DNA_ID=CAMNT_0047524683 /DNA_START=221 /DNA_END=542 /DNA_ORIENTATION=+
MELREFELWPQQQQWIDQQQRNGNSDTGSKTANQRGQGSIDDADRSLKRINPDPSSSNISSNNSSGLVSSDANQLTAGLRRRQVQTIDDLAYPQAIAGDVRIGSQGT